MAEYDLIASAAFGMEAIVVRELGDLGYTDATVADGRVRFKGDEAAICRANLWLRCAERVQVVVGDFPARDFDQLFDQVKAIHWEDWLPVDARFPVTARCVRSDIRSVPNTQKMVKRAIVDRLRQVYMRHWFAETGVEYCIDAHVLADRVLITLDTTGDGLHKRGYRNLVGRAPLRETLAAGMVKLSYWNRDRLLVDPFCGSGTIPIEAAMIGRNLAPGRNRSFSAENWVQIPRTVWSAARQEARDLEIRQPLSVPIVATDRDRYAIKMAVQHARQAGVESDIHFDVRDFVAFPTNRNAGILICNPPYGERLGEEQEVRQLYSDMGELLRPLLDDWSLYILTGAEGFEHDFGQVADRRRKLYNARIACTFYQYLGPKPAGVSAESISEMETDAESGTELHADEDAHTSSDVPFAPQSENMDESSANVAEESVSAVSRRSDVREPSEPEVTRPRVPADNPWSKARVPSGTSSEQSRSQSEQSRTPATSAEPEPARYPWGESSPEKSRAENPPATDLNTPAIDDPTIDEAGSEAASPELIDKRDSTSPSHPEESPADEERSEDEENTSPEVADLPAPQAESAVEAGGAPALDPEAVETPNPNTPAKHPWKKNPWRK